MEFTANKCKVLHIGATNANMEYTLGNYNLASVEHETDLGVVIDNNLKVNRHCTITINKANRVLGLIGRSFDFKNESIVATLYKAMVRPYLEYCSPFWAPIYKKDINRIENVQRRATKMCLSLWNLPYETRLTKLNLQTLSKRRIRTDLIELYKMIHKISRLEFSNYFTFSYSGTRGNTLKVSKDRMCSSNIAKHWYFNRVVNAWNSLSNAIVNAENTTTFR